MLYTEEFLRCPTKEDLKNITKLLQVVHGTEGLLGSLDCTHTFWKNSPKGWQGSYKGKEAKPTIVMEAMSDYNLFFWHASYGYTGTLNDISILSLSPLLDRMVSGELHRLEEESGVAPFQIGKDRFSLLFILVLSCHEVYFFSNSEMGSLIPFTNLLYGGYMPSTKMKSKLNLSLPI
jgi:hypothetical protein